MNKKLAYLLPLRCVVFVLIFLAASLVTGKALSEISNIWSVVASLVNMVTILLLLCALTQKDGGYGKLIRYEKGKATMKQILATSAIPGFYEMMCGM